MNVEGLVCNYWWCLSLMVAQSCFVNKVISR